MDNEELQEYIDGNRMNGDCVVAYLDILGFKDIVNKYLNPQIPTDKDIINIIISAMESTKRSINEFLSNSEFKNIEIIKFKQFPDCICLSIPDLKGKDSEAAMLGMFLLTLKNYYFNFIRQNLYLKCGVSIGSHYEDDNIIFSDGLIKAYYPYFLIQLYLLVYTFPFIFPLIILFSHQKFYSNTSISINLS